MSGGINDLVPFVKPGDWPSAKAWNTIAGNINRLNQFGKGGNEYGMANGSGVYSGDDIPDPGILFYNGAATQVPNYGVMLLNGSQTVGGGVCPQIKQPDTYGCQTNVLVNGDSPVNAGGYGYAQFLNGPLIAAYDSADGTPAAGQRWGNRSGTWLLKKNTGGFRIIGVWDSTNHYALVMPEPMFTFRGQPTGDIATGVTGTVTIFYGGTTTSVTMSSVLNDTSCTAKGSKNVTCMYMWDKEDTNPWQIVNAYTS